MWLDRPEAPLNVEVGRCGSSVAEVVWQAASSNNEPILDYIVDFNTSTDSPGVRQEGAVVDAAARSALVALRPWANYTFRVSARNRLGIGPASRPTSVVCTTPPAKPYSNPTDVCSNLTRSSQLIIMWQVCRHTSVISLSQLGLSHSGNVRSCVQLQLNEKAQGLVILTFGLLIFKLF